jgi:hypothetical protein
MRLTKPRGGLIPFPEPGLIRTGPGAGLPATSGPVRRRAVVRVNGATSRWPGIVRRTVFRCLVWGFGSVSFSQAFTYSADMVLLVFPLRCLH